MNVVGVCCVGEAHRSCVSTSPESPAVCPNCGSDHVVLLALSGEPFNREQNQGEQLQTPSQSPSSVCDCPGHSNQLNKADSIPPQVSISHGDSSWSLSPREYGQNKMGVGLGSDGHVWKVEMEPWAATSRLMAYLLSPAPEPCGLRSVDHRLRLFLDVEVFTDAQEEFQCCIKVCCLALPSLIRVPTVHSSS
jgi:hypothetical protein